MVSQVISKIGVWFCFVSSVSSPDIRVKLSSSQNEFGRFPPSLGTLKPFSPVVRDSSRSQPQSPFRGSSSRFTFIFPQLPFSLFLLCPRSVLRIHTFPESCHFLEDTVMCLCSACKVFFTRSG